MSDFNEAAWLEALEAWDKMEDLRIGYETRKDAFLQGYYSAVNKRAKTEGATPRFSGYGDTPRPADYFEDKLMDMVLELHRMTGLKSLIKEITVCPKLYMYMEDSIWRKTIRAGRELVKGPKQIAILTGVGEVIIKEEEKKPTPMAGKVPNCS